MQANPDKFQVLAVGKKTFNKNPCFHIKNSDLSCEATVKLLGIDIDYQLNFYIHIGKICRKASQQLIFSTFGIIFELIKQTDHFSYFHIK